MVYITMFGTMIYNYIIIYYNYNYGIYLHIERDISIL